MMKLTLLVKLAPDDEQYSLLLQTMERFNEACDDIANVAHHNRLANNWALHKLVYYRIREQYGLSAQMTVRAIGKVVEAYKRDKNILCKFKPHGAMIYARASQRSRLHSWGFYQLRHFVEYKARLEGVQVISVCPRGTSHICPACGVEDRKNRPVRDLFRCIGCGYAGHADHVAAVNIAARANVNRPIVSEDFFEHVTHLQGQAPQFIGG